MEMRADEFHSRGASLPTPGDDGWIGFENVGLNL